MRRKGKVKYVPPNVLQELENVKAERNFDSDADAFKDMVRYCEIGRELEKMRRSMFPLIERKGKRR